MAISQVSQEEMHVIFFHQWFVGSTHVEFVLMQHVLTYIYFFLSDSKAMWNYYRIIFFESQETGWRKIT